jgi:uncharacterized protein YaiI (UPF0178 family)
MNIWIVFDDCPQDFGEKEIRKVFSSRRLAEYYIANQKIKHPYENQYLVIKRFKVDSQTTIG